MKTVLNVTLAALFAITLSGLVIADWQNTPFIRGDANQQSLVTQEDADFILAYLYSGGPAPKCMDSADWNDDGRVDISDAIGISNWLQNGNGGGGGFQLISDRTADALDCKSYRSG